MSVDPLADLAVAAVFDALAIPITYRPRLGEAAVVQAVQVRPPPALDALGGGRVAHDGLIAQIRAADYVKSDYERRVFAVSPKINLSNVSNTFTLQYHSPDNATGVTCAYSAILALRLDGFEAAYTNQDYAASPINTGQTGYQDALTVSATPAAVAHLIIATSHQRINSNTISDYQQLITDNPSTTFAEYTQEGVNASSYYGLGLAAVTTPAASAANWKWQYKCEASSTAYAADWRSPCCGWKPDRRRSLARRSRPSPR